MREWAVIIAVTAAIAIASGIATAIWITPDCTCPEQKVVEPVTVMYSPRVASVTAVTLNIRDGAGTQAAVIGQTRQGDPVLLFGEPVVTDSQTWQRACNSWGWVATEYVK